MVESVWKGSGTDWKARSGVSRRRWILRGSGAGWRKLLGMKKRNTAIGEVEAATAASEPSSTQRLTQRASALWKSYGQYIYSPSLPTSRATLGPRDLLNARTLQDMKEEDADLKLLAQRHAKASEIEESITLFPSYARERSTYSMSPESNDRSK